MSAEKFHPGDRVVFRDWDDMAEEFGTQNGGSSINVAYTFTKHMRHLCGQEFTVSKCRGEIVYLEESTAAPGSSREWTISTGMLRYADDWDVGSSAGDFLSELI